MFDWSRPETEICVKDETNVSLVVSRKGIYWTKLGQAIQSTWASLVRMANPGPTLIKTTYSSPESQHTGPH